MSIYTYTYTLIMASLVAQHRVGLRQAAGRQHGGLEDRHLTIVVTITITNIITVLLYYSITVLQ